MLQRVWKKEKLGVLTGTAAFLGSEMFEPPLTDSFRHTTLGECLVCDSGVTAHFVIIWKVLKKGKEMRGVMLSQHVGLHLFWHMLCILLIQIPWLSDKSVTLFLGPDNQPRSSDGLACPRREKN